MAQTPITVTWSSAGRAEVRDSSIVLGRRAAQRHLGPTPSGSGTWKMSSVKEISAE